MNTYNTNPTNMMELWYKYGFWYVLWVYTPLEAWAIFVTWRMLKYRDVIQQEMMEDYDNSLGETK